jgi:N-acetyl-gamma-glutamyl-phosphate reductase
MVRVGIVGGTGYTGVELLRLLLPHPEVALTVLTSRGEAGRRVDALFPNLRGHCDLSFCDPDAASLQDCEIVFFATPHNVAVSSVPKLLDAGIRVIDLSADFRLRDAQQWAHWYGEPHAAPDLLAEAVYGLPERNREAIRSARLVACPGCYPTAVQLGLRPLLTNRLVDASRLVANAASGVSGAGRQGRVANLFSELSDSFKAYGVTGHRHLPEIEQELALDNNGAVAVTFVPHLLPTVRGIHATLYAPLNEAGRGRELQTLFEDFYAEEPFVQVLPAGTYPETRAVRGANFCQLAVTVPQGRDMAVVLAVEDNLVKGAAGQAVQNMNLMLGLPETTGLGAPGLLP